MAELIQARCHQCGCTEPDPTMAGDDNGDEIPVYWFQLMKDTEGNLDPQFMAVAESGDVDTYFIASPDKDLKIREDQIVVCPECMPLPEEELS